MKCELRGLSSEDVGSLEGDVGSHCRNGREELVFCPEVENCFDKLS